MSKNNSSDTTDVLDSQQQGWTTRLGLEALLIFLALALLILGPAAPDYARATITYLAVDAGRPDLAENALRLILKAQPGSPQFNEALGTSLSLQGKYSEAISAYLRAISLDSDLASAQNNLGVTLIDQSEAAQAIAHLLVAVELDPGEAALHYNLGNAYQIAGYPQLAAQAYQRAYMLDAGQVDAMAQWARIALETGQIEEARAAWESVLAQSPDHPLAHKGLGAIAVLQGRYEQALPQIEAGLASDPQDGTTRYYLGLALQGLGRSAEAATEFKQAMALSSDPILIDLATNRLRSIRP